MLSGCHLGITMQNTYFFSKSMLIDFTLLSKFRFKLATQQNSAFDSFSADVLNDPISEVISETSKMLYIKTQRKNLIVVRPIRKVDMYVNFTVIN